MQINHIGVILNLIGGLAVFLFGLEFLSSSLKRMNKEKIKNFLLKYSNNDEKSILTGALTTTILDSSSATIILLIAFLDANLLHLRNAVGIVLGANIGTTISSQIIAFQVGQYSSLVLLFGVVGSIFAKNDKIKIFFNALIGFSMIFYGLHLMDLAVSPYKESEKVMNLMKNLNNPLTGALIGALVTIIIQSSSATVGISIILGSQGLISFEAAVSIMHGSEIGTCFDTIIAAIGKNKEAIKLGLFHLFFNMFSVALGLIFFYNFCHLVSYISQNSSIERKIANAHMLFNVLSVAIFYILIKVNFRFFKNKTALI
jgi:phosphate:Na+ symporter